MNTRGVVERNRRHSEFSDAAGIHGAQDDSAEVIGLFTSELMLPAQQLYKSLGFHRDSELPMRFGLRYWRHTVQLTGPMSSVREELDTLV